MAVPSNNAIVKAIKNQIADLMVNIQINSLNNADDIKDTQKAIKDFPKDTLMTLEEMQLMTSVDQALKQCKAATTRTLGAVESLIPKYIEMGLLKKDYKEAYEAGQSVLVGNSRASNQPCQPEKKRTKYNPHDPSQQLQQQQQHPSQGDLPPDMTQDPNEIVGLVSYEECMQQLLEQQDQGMEEYVPSPVTPEQHMMTQVKATPPQNPGYWRPPQQQQKRPGMSKVKNVNVKK